MRTLFIALLLSAQVALGQSKLLIDPCHDNILPWGSSLATLKASAKKLFDGQYRIYTSQVKGFTETTVMGFKSPFSIVYTFNNGVYVSYTKLYTEEKRSDIERLTQEQVKLLASSGGRYVSEDTYIFPCKGEEIQVHIGLFYPSLNIVVKNINAWNKSIAKH